MKENEDSTSKLSVEHLKVSRKVEGTGIGRLLFAHAEQQLQEMATNASNNWSDVKLKLLCVLIKKPAINFYINAGWTQFPFVKNQDPHCEIQFVAFGKVVFRMHQRRVARYSLRVNILVD